MTSLPSPSLSGNGLLSLACGSPAQNFQKHLAIFRAQSALPLFCLQQPGSLLLLLLLLLLLVVVVVVDVVVFMSIIFSNR